MSLLVPAALFGLLTIPIILILHLLRNRREHLSISSLRLWLGLQQQREGGLPRSIPLTLLLILQLLAAAFLTFSLSQPVSSFFLPQPQHYIFILDTTTSMLAEDQSAFGSDGALLGTTRRFDVARQTVQERLRSLTDDDSFVIIDLADDATILLSGEGIQRDEAVLTLDNFVPGGVGADLSTAITLANGLLADDRPNQITILTDGNYRNDAAELPPVMAPLEWLSFGVENTANQALVNVSATQLPDGQYRVFARVINYADTTVERTLQLASETRVIDESPISLEAQGEVTRIWTVPASAGRIKVEILEADGLPLDNQAELLLTTTTSHQVLLFTRVLDEELSAAQDALVRAFEAQSGVVVTVADMSELETIDLLNFDLVVFDSLPPSLMAWPAGNLLVLNPTLEHPLLSGQEYMRNLRPNPSSGSELAAGIDWSGVHFKQLISIAPPIWADVDLVASGTPVFGESQREFPLIFHGTVDDSRIVVWTFDLAQSNLPARLALPLLTGNTLSNLLFADVPPVISVGQPVDISQNTAVELPSGQRLSPSPVTSNVNEMSFTRTKLPGVYQIYDQQDKVRGGFAVHAGSALESNLTTRFDSNLVQTVDIGAGEAPIETDFEEYWSWLAIAALIIVVVEGGLAWRK